jgi:hypothetical protein
VSIQSVAAAEVTIQTRDGIATLSVRRSDSESVPANLVETHCFASGFNSSVSQLYVTAISTEPVGCKAAATFEFYARENCVGVAHAQRMLEHVNTGVLFSGTDGWEFRKFASVRITTNSECGTIASSERFAKYYEGRYEYCLPADGDPLISTDAGCEYASGIRGYVQSRFPQDIPSHGQEWEAFVLAMLVVTSIICLVAAVLWIKVGAYKRLRMKKRILTELGYLSDIVMNVILLVNVYEASKSVTYEGTQQTGVYTDGAWAQLCECGDKICAGASTYDWLYWLTPLIPIVHSLEVWYYFKNHKVFRKAASMLDSVLSLLMSIIVAFEINRSRVTNVYRRFSGDIPLSICSPAELSPEALSLVSVISSSMLTGFSVFHFLWILIRLQCASGSANASARPSRNNHATDSMTESVDDGPDPGGDLNKLKISMMPRDSVSLSDRHTY